MTKPKITKQVTFNEESVRQSKRESNVIRSKRFLSEVKIEPPSASMGFFY